MTFAVRRCLCLFMLLCTAACRERIQHGLDERQANELQTVLAERGLDARKVPEAGKKPTWAIEVEEAQASDAVRILAELGLPRPAEEMGCDVFGGGGLIRSPVEEQLCRGRVLERGVEKTLQGVDGVLLARVHLMVPPPPRPGQASAPAKASAMLRTAPGQAARIRQAQEQLRALIAGGVEGLSPDSVALMVDEASTRVEVTVPGSSPLMRLRVLLVVMGVVLTALAVALVFLALRLRNDQSEAMTPPVAPPVPARPVVAANAARRVA
ncbi:flagellar M-ring protein FliF [Hyalangium minutum]|uniref:Type III secretion bridge between inner and outermembrane lipoprotein (YscJ,HrcJ,EscJ, PscJ) n=1 Tax=Hyalangium minutum TaxID=394096 RepID=A0A085W6Y4_9BACT|nr:flagellar M-ring protein FliF [Hyalangium minutum]KFE63447.1 Type III secretion bridge between inner and outermembrane lipoprotein (YscJ,HrcJ,EscJ, PscJ) [Hyalangium minutum]